MMIESTVTFCFNRSNHESVIRIYSPFKCGPLKRAPLEQMSTMVKSCISTHISTRLRRCLRLSNERFCFTGMGFGLTGCFPTSDYCLGLYEMFSSSMVHLANPENDNGTKFYEWESAIELHWNCVLVADCLGVCSNSTFRLVRQTCVAV